MPHPANPNPNNNKATTPQLANRLAARWLPGALLEELLGDLHEVYHMRLAARGRTYARLMYWFDVVHLLFGFARMTKVKTQNNSLMIKSMFKIAWRSALRHRLFTGLNLLGLTIGIATTLVISLYVYEQQHYDTFHTKANRIYRINQPMIWDDWQEQSASLGPGIADALRKDLPEFEAVTRLLARGPQTTRRQGKVSNAQLFKEARFFPADENFFDVFTFDFIRGDATTALAGPGSMVMTYSTAQRYFGHQNPMGKVVEVKNFEGQWQAFTVKAVLADLPDNSHLQFDILVSLTSYPEEMKQHGWKWIWTTFSTYGLVHEGTNIAALEQKMQALPPKYAPATTERILNQPYEKFTKGNDWRLYLQPLKDVYRAGAPGWHRFGPTGKPRFVVVFTAIGALVLLLSCINFMNLSTARSANRAKEVGIRKVLGSNRAALTRQFVFESVLFVAAGTLLALVAVYFALGAFNAIANTHMALLPYLTQPAFIALLLAFIALLGILAGSYPAFYLSSFRPIATLKGKISTGFKGRALRNGLVVFQFTISIGLTICAFFVQQQLRYTSNLDLGMGTEQVLQLHYVDELGKNDEVLLATLANNPAFTHVGKSFALPFRVWDGERYKTEDPNGPSVDMNNFRADGAYLKVLDLQFVAGRNFDPTITTDKYAAVINETAARALGWGTASTWGNNSPVGKDVICDFDNELPLEVIGVVEDFIYSSMHDKIEPLVILSNGNDSLWNYGIGKAFISMKLNPAQVQTATDVQQAIEDLQLALNKVDATVPFEYSFLDQQFEATFKSEQQMGSILNAFTLMALAIACLGLFGLAAFSAEQRTKELSIRKVLGARVSELVLLFSAEFTRLVVLAIVLAVPIAYYLVNQWLGDFAYRTPIYWWVFALAALAALTIAFLTISYQSLTAAYKNPAETLKDE